MRTLIAASLAAVSLAYDHWAVLIAGSNTYSNYRHQSDVHHAYQIMKKNGIPESNIILMSYDDIAQNYRNPFPGQIFNQPDGENVYFQKDISYSGRDVTAENFLAVLKGDSTTTGGKPVLKSTSKSKVFVYYADHGATGFVGMPSGGYLYADQLSDALDYMEANNMYDELVFYLEACESGSMFPNLQSNSKAYAMTASNAYLSSYAAYCGSDAYVNGTYIGSCLGDLFSINWMEDTDAANISTETLATQQATVIKETTASPVQVFGDQSFLSEPIGDFEGALDEVAQRLKHDLEDLFDEHKGLKKAAKWGKKMHNRVKHAKEFAHEKFGKRKHIKTVDQRDIELVELFEKYMETGFADDRVALEEMLAHRAKADRFFANIMPSFKMDQEIKIEDYDCYRFLVNTYESTCEPFSFYSAKYAKVLGHACNTHSDFELAQLVNKIQAACQ